jgi:pimeloyl-ACP methyl ester carboxylesterase
LRKSIYRKNKQHVISLVSLHSFRRTSIESTISLIDGRTLAYAEYGDSRGKPVFFFHGTPGSRIFRPPDELTARLGVRLITTDRPGYGESTFQSGRRILDWPEDIAQLADALGIDKFAVAGHSGGGPYVSACAFALPDRVTTAAILSGAGPMESPTVTRGMSATNKFGLIVGSFIPWTFWRALIWVFYHRRSCDPAADMDRGSGHRPRADEEQIHRFDVREACIRSEVEAFRPGLRGLAWDARLLTRPWGFRLEDIHVQVYLWHGTDDDQATVAMARYIAGKIPKSKITICENEAHLLLFPHWEEILTQLTSE